MKATVSDQVVISQVVVSEDIREEISGKHSLIGVYTGDIGVRQFPAKIRLAYFIEVRVSAAGDHRIVFRIMFNAKEAGQFNTSLPAPHAGVGILVLPRMGIPLNEPTKIRLEVRTSDDQWVSVEERTVMLSATMAEYAAAAAAAASDAEAKVEPGIPSNVE
jgi:hypothetical protein